jgi:hypothetical protein
MANARMPEVAVVYTRVDGSGQREGVNKVDWLILTAYGLPGDLMSLAQKQGVQGPPSDEILGCGGRTSGGGAIRTSSKIFPARLFFICADGEDYVEVARLYCPGLLRIVSVQPLASAWIEESQLPDAFDTDWEIWYWQLGPNGGEKEKIKKIK